jgi:hypothetical protein
MKDQVVLKDNKWIWPVSDKSSWNGQNESIDIADKIIPYVKNKNIMIQAGGNCGFLLSKFVEHFNTVKTAAGETSILSERIRNLKLSFI